VSILKLLSFRGGVHPHDHKEITKDKKITELSPPDTLYIPMQMHIGAPCVPKVEVGERVLMGQIIGDSDAYVSVPVHASVSGTVKEIKKILLPNGSMSDAVVIENDFKDEPFDEHGKNKDYTKFSRQEIIKMVREAGVVGMGGAGFPTHVKLSPPEGKVIDTVIVNGAECEPYLTSDYRVMLENPEEVIYGLKVLLYAFGIKNGYIGIEDNKKEAIKKMQEKTKNEEGIRVVALKTKYPQGSEKQLIWSITKREVPRGGLPADVGVICVNIDTCCAIAKKFLYNRPLIRRIVTVSGSGIKEPQNFSVRIGTPFSYVIEAAGGMAGDVKKVIMGGPMMGIAQYDLNVPVVKGTSAILLFTEKELKQPNTDVCFRCGRCSYVCPINLMPYYIADAYRIGDIERCEKLGALDCIECGCCSFTCPGNAKPLSRVREAKRTILENRRQKA